MSEPSSSSRANLWRRDVEADDGGVDAVANMLEAMGATQAAAAAVPMQEEEEPTAQELEEPAPPAAYAPRRSAYQAGDNWIMPMKAKYEGYLCHFMAFIHSLPERYPKGTTFTRAQLLQIHPQHILDWLAFKAYGKADYDIDAGDRPKFARASHLEQIKKGISFFMPNHDNPWMNGEGNPTKHRTLRVIIDQVKVFEVRGQGAPSKAKRAMTIPEFKCELALLDRKGKEDDDYDFLVRYRAMALWQFHLIGRIDDVCNFGMANPKGHGTFDFAAKTKVQWSKNVRDEQKCPDQILLGAEDP